MKTKNRSRFAAVFLALAMLLSLVPFEMFVSTRARAEDSKTYTLESKNLTAFAQNTKTDGAFEKAGTSDYFTLYYSSKTRIDSSSKSFDDGYSSSQRINFGGKADATTPKNVIWFKTSGAATVKVWWVHGGKADTDANTPNDYREITILDSNGSAVATTSEHPAKDAKLKSTLELSDAGTYYLGSTPNNNYIFKVEVTEGESAPVVRNDWNDVAAPVIGTITANGSKVTVPVTAVVGANGGDEVVVTMHDSTGKQVDTKRSTAEAGSHNIEFTPKASGTYTFKATLSRDGETEKVSAADGTCNFVLPLAKPTITSATNKGSGSIEIKWGAVAEATGYEIYINGTKADTSDTTAYTATGLTVGTEYKFTVAAIRNAETGSKSAEFSATVKNTVEREWAGIYYGGSTGSSKNKVEGSINADGKIKIYGNGGKIVPGGNEGVTFYYTPIPDNMNFTLRGKFTVDTWTLSNGQEGFGILALDSLPAAPNTTANHWTNEYMMGVMKTEYYWDPFNNKFIYDGSGGDKYTMKQGVGILARTGITSANYSASQNVPLINEVAPKTTYPLEKSAISMNKDPGTYNIVGNATNAPIEGSLGTLKTEFVFELQRNNTGYFMTYYDQNGSVIGRQKFYDTKALSSLDKDNVYVGFFAARNFVVDVSDVTLTTIAPEDDAPAEERPIELIEPSISITSAVVSNAPDYTLMLNANVAGTADITLNGEAAGSGNLTAKTLFSKALELDQGVNQISVVFKPDPDQTLAEYTKLANSDPITVEINVNYNTRLSEQNNLYVSPKGSKNGNGGKDHPLDIHTAVSLVRPGQTIILMEGTYSLTSPVRIERGMGGTADAKIRMIADPDAATRPVLDFNKVCEGVRLGGNYWYVQGFDVTNTGNGLAGFRVCGSYNTLDRIEAHDNGNTGIQISAFRDSSDPRELWPHDNLILNCTSYNNADYGYEDADGFAAKITIGDGNVFDGCAAYNNADDGWDLYAKVSSGPIGSVTVKNCIAYNNGIMLDGTNAGNGNGFKLGGENLPGGHKLINSLAFNNKANGITSNSCPDVQVTNCTSFNNGGKNLTLYCNNANTPTNFKVNGVISSKGGIADDIKKTEKDSGTEVNNHKTNVDESAFVSTTFGGLMRKENGTLDLGGFLKLKDDADKTIGADFDKPGSSQPSEDIGEIVPDENLPAPLPEYVAPTPLPGDDKKPTEFEDNKTEIEVTAPDGAFDDVENVKFNADPVPEETNEEEFTYDLFFTDKDGNKLQPKTAVTVKIPVPTALKDKTIFVYHIENDGKYTEIDCKVENGMVVFTATSFSKYIITSKKLAASNDSSDTSSDVSANDSNSGTSSGSSNPSTGVTIPMTRFIVFFGGAAALCVFKRRSK